MSYAAIHPNWEKPRANMVDGYSLEMTAKEIEGLREAAPQIRPGTQIAVTFLPGEEMEQRVEAAVLVRELGFEPIVHLSARRITSEAELDQYLSDITTKAGVKRVFIIAGDPPEPEGPYSTSLDIIETGPAREIRDRDRRHRRPPGRPPEQHPGRTVGLDGDASSPRSVRAGWCRWSSPSSRSTTMRSSPGSRKCAPRDRRPGAPRRPRPGRDQAPARLRQALRRGRFGQRDEEIRHLR